MLEIKPRWCVPLRSMCVPTKYTTKVALRLISSIERDENCTKERITHTNFKVLN